VRLIPGVHTAPAWRFLLQRGDGAWVGTRELEAVTGGRLDKTLRRWAARGWLERRILPQSGAPVEWRLTREGRIGAHAVVAAANARELAR
jgi:hypothetical protein